MLIPNIVYTNGMFIIFHHQFPKFGPTILTSLQDFPFKSQHVSRLISMFDGEQTKSHVYKTHGLRRGFTTNSSHKMDPFKRAWFFGPILWGCWDMTFINMCWRSYISCPIILKLNITQQICSTIHIYVIYIYNIYNI